jgi:hypothetical protein
LFFQNFLRCPRQTAYSKTGLLVEPSLGALDSGYKGFFRFIRFSHDPQRIGHAEPLLSLVILNLHEVLAVVRPARRERTLRYRARARYGSYMVKRFVRPRAAFSINMGRVFLNLPPRISVLVYAARCRYFLIH